MRRPIGKPPKSTGDSVAIETVCAIARLTAADGGKAPTRRDLARDLGLSSVATVIERLAVLKRRGLVDYEIGSMRSLTLTTAGRTLAADHALDEPSTCAFDGFDRDRWE